MKKNLLSFLLVGLSGSVLAQGNFTFTDANSSNVTTTTQYYWIDQDVLDSRDFTMTNISATTIDVKVRRTNIQLNTPTAYSSFCTCTNCYGPGTNMSVLFTLAPGGTCVLTADYFPDSTGGTGHVRYTMLDQTNLADSSTFDIIYNPAPAGINAHVFAKPSISNPAPNPASSVFSMTYKLGSTNPAGAKMVVCNMLGDRVMETPIEEIEGTVKMDVSSLDQGVYFCSLESDGKSLATRRLIVTH